MSDPNLSAPQASSSPRWMRILLFVSLGLNLLVAGAVLSAMFKHGPFGGRTDGPRDLASAFYFSALPHEDRMEVFQQVRRDGRSHSDRSVLRADVDATIALLKADVLDKAALLEAIQRQRGHMSRRREFGDRVFVDHIANMGPEERQAYAQRLEERLKRVRDPNH